MFVGKGNVIFGNSFLITLVMVVFLYWWECCNNGDQVLLEFKHVFFLVFQAANFKNSSITVSEVTLNKVSKAAYQVSLLYSNLNI